MSSRFNFYESYLILKFLTLFFFYHYYAHECDTSFSISSFSISSISISSFSISSFSISSVLLLLLLLLLILLIYHPIQSSLYFNTFFHAYSLFDASSLSSSFFFILFFLLISLFYFFLLISLFFFIRFWSYSFLPLLHLQREQALLYEIDRLKSIIFEVQQERDKALERVEELYLQKLSVQEDCTKDQEV